MGWGQLGSGRDGQGRGWVSRGGVGGSEWGRVVEVGGDRGRGGARWEVGVGGSGRVVIWSRCGEVMGWGGGGWGVGGHGPGSLAHRLGLSGWLCPRTEPSTHHYYHKPSHFLAALACALSRSSFFIAARLNRILADRLVIPSPIMMCERKGWP